jgi:hypothetical protein
VLPQKLNECSQTAGLFTEILWFLLNNDHVLMKLPSGASPRTEIDHMRTGILAPVLFAAMTAASFSSTNVRAADPAKIDCEMRFNLSGWSAIYKHAEGRGTITCNNGKTFDVNIVAVGGGLTVGKSHIEGGKGKFSAVSHTQELFGDYAQAEANAGVVKSGTAQVLTKGTATLALAGAGEGVDIGLSVGKFTISRVK